MNKVLAMYPERVPSLLKMAQLKFILKDFDGSVLTVNEAIRLDPQNADAYFMLGMNFKALGDSKRAINAYQTSVELNSGLTDAWIILGEMHEGQDDGKALRYYENAILSNAKSMQALHAKAYFLQNHGNIPGAQQIYKQIIATDSSYADAYLNAGLLYLEADSLEMAYQNFTKMTAIAPRNHMAYYLRGKVAEKKKDVKSAQKDYETALNLKNNDKNVMDALNSLKKRG
jgi:tetratricopeptide (TPR) repeat protein